MKEKWFKRLRIAALALAGVALACWFAHVRRSGPVYEGKRIRAWVAQVCEPDQREQRAAQDVLLRIGEPAVPHLTAALQRLMASRPATWVDNVIKRFVPRRFQPRFLSPYEAEMAQSRILWTLQLMGPVAGSAAADVAKILERTVNVHVRSSGAEALGRMGPAGLEYVRQGITHADGQLRLNYYRAAYLLGTNAAVLMPELMRQFEQYPMERAHIALTFGSIGDAAGEFVERLIESSDRDRMTHGVRALSITRFPRERTIARLIELQNDPDARMREMVYQALGNHAAIAPAARASLKNALHDEDFRVQLTGLTMIQQFPRDASSELLRIIEFLDSPSSSLQLAAIECLGNLGHLARPAAPKLRQIASARPPSPQLTPAASNALQVITQSVPPPNRASLQELQQRR